MSANKYIEQRFQDHNEWIKSIETDTKDHADRIGVLEQDRAGMTEAIKSLANDMKDFKEVMKIFRQALDKLFYGLIFGFLVTIFVGIIFIIVQGGR